MTILELRQARDPEIAALADYVYEHVFVHYTMKQWGQTPEEIDPNTTARVPVFLSRDDRYFQDTYQGMPLEGLYRPVPADAGPSRHHGGAGNGRPEAAGPVRRTDPLDGTAFSGPVIYTGQADEAVRFPLRSPALSDAGLPVRDPGAGRLPGLRYGQLHHGRGLHPHYGFKHLTGQVRPGVTTIVKEYSRAFTGALVRSPLCHHQSGERPPVRPVPGGALSQPVSAGPPGRVQIPQHGRHRVPGAGAGRAADLSRAL